MNKVVLVTGGFDPIHSGHIAFFKAARKLGDQLVVGVNTDAWLSRKKGKAFMSFDERYAVIGEMECVDKVIGFDDDDGTAKSAIKQILQTKNPNWKVVFANGGDRIMPQHPNISNIKAIGRLNFALASEERIKKIAAVGCLKSGLSQL